MSKSQLKSERKRDRKRSVRYLKILFVDAITRIVYVSVESAQIIDGLKSVPLKAD